MNNVFKLIIAVGVAFIVSILLISIVAIYTDTPSYVEESPDSLIEESPHSLVDNSPNNKPKYPLTNIDIIVDKVDEMKVSAEVFRTVNGYYKDVHRKEEIIIYVCSDGKRYLKPNKIVGSSKNFFDDIELAVPVNISSLKDYEYEIWYHEKGGEIKIYAFNEQDIH